MVKESMRFSVIYLLTSIIWKFITKQEIDWIDHIGVSITVFFISLFYNWSKVPYKWKKDNNFS